ncbi:MAG: D-(-)-3-hydroxybutyrate oligomer hydrolase [Betaproteobacteria bacterium]|nr:D-(-)-3-hydroxybutyrate oligomer hydrolase [Betaproteobacteria bacterium]
MQPGRRVRLLRTPHPQHWFAPVAGLLLALASCTPALGGERERGIGDGPNLKPRWLGSVRSTAYDGVRDDLLTAGLGKTGLGGAAPAVTNPQDAAQLRRLAIWTNYRAVLDISPAGGYGTLYGPNVRPDGTVTANEGLIAGTEHLAFADDGSGRENVTLMVQVPASFDPAHACIVSGSSSGSRGVYGAIGTSGEWGLKHGCAVAYADKGSGNGVHDLATNTVNLIDGVRADAATAGRASNFTAALSPTALQQFNADYPHRIAVKHAHSQVNPEKDWGRDTLRSIELAFYVLNEQFGPPLPRGLRQRVITSRNTVVIAAGISNGAGAALAAAEQDRRGLIDGVAVSEPQVQTRLHEPPAVQRGTRPAYTAGSRPLLDYFTFANLYQPCAALSARAATAALPFPAALVPLAQARCQSLADKGLLNGATTAQQADDALDRLLAYGWEPDTIAYQVSHWRFATPAIAMTYSNSYGRFSVADNLCGFSFAATDAATGVPAAINPIALALVFGTGNGVPPSSGINIVNNLSVGGARLDTISVSPSTLRADFNLDGALCQRALITGHDANALRTRIGIAQVQQHADLDGKPAIIVHGRSDTLVPVNFSSRAYYAANQDEEQSRSRLRYIEVTNAQHFDSFLGFPGYANTLVPLHVYFNRALDAMFAHLTAGAALPPSQVVRTTPRGGSFPAPPITPANVPPWSAAPGAADLITFDDEVLHVPE